MKESVDERRTVDFVAVDCTSREKRLTVTRCKVSKKGSYCPGNERFCCRNTSREIESDLLWTLKSH